MEMIHEIEVIAEYEGYTIEEAKLTYAARQKLPAGAFCGPERSYPAHDAAHVRNGFARLGTFGKRLPKAVAMRIYRCLVRRAKRFGIDHDPKRFAWLTGRKTVEESFQEDAKDTEKKLKALWKEMGWEWKY